MKQLRNQELLIAFGNRVRELRIAKGLSMERLAELAGIEYSQVSRVEFGQINTTISTANALAVGLGLSLYELFRPLHYSE